MKRTVRAATCLCVLQLSLSGMNAAGQGSDAGGLAIGDDGWYSWRVAAHRSDYDWCCGQWSMGAHERSACNLDARSRNISITDSGSYGSGEMQIYVLLDAGKLRQVRTLSPHCPVRTEQAMSDLGPVDSGTSLDWLQEFVGAQSPLASDVMAAISVHEGTRARDALLDIAQNDRDTGRRTDAIEWLGLSRIDETRDVIRELAFEERRFEVQEAAVMALALLPPDEAARELIAIIEKPGVDMEVRRTALFSLAHTDSELVIPWFSALLASR